MKTILDAYGEIYNHKSNDPVDDLGEIREAISNLNDMFGSASLETAEDQVSGDQYGAVVQKLISDNFSQAIDNLEKIVGILEKYDKTGS